MALVPGRPYNWPFDGDLTPSNTCVIVIDMQARPPRRPPRRRGRRWRWRRGGPCNGVRLVSAPAPLRLTLHYTVCPAGGLLQQRRLRGPDGPGHLPHSGPHRAHPVRRRRCLTSAPLPHFYSRQRPWHAGNLAAGLGAGRHFRSLPQLAAGSCWRRAASRGTM